VKDDAPFQTRELINHLEEHKISTRRVFAGNITRQPGFQHLPKIAFDLSGSDKVMNDMFWVGCHPSLTQEMLDYMVEVFDKFFKSRGL
jgi:CDP-6-deoxy-D-xylo-4-hexulose-3-dehydrase